MSDPRTDPPAEHPWLIAATVMLGTFMAVMDVSVVNVALPHMMGTFSVDLSEVTWVATGYAIAQILVMTMSGWLSAIVGRKRLYVGSMVVFIVGSVLAGTARSFGAMLLYRAIQGAGGGAMIPVALSILRETFGKAQQGMAMAVYGMGVVLAPAIGPVLGGWLTDTYGWPWIFYINVPVSVPALLLALALLRDPPYLRRGVARIDWAGLALLAVGLTSLQLVLERGQEEDWFASRWIVAGTVVAVAALAALAVWELRARHPVVNVRLFGNGPLALSSVIGLVFGVALFGTTFMLPQFTQTLLGYPAFQSGLAVAPRAASLFVTMPVAGWLLKHLDGRVLILGGIALICWGYWDLAHLSLDVGFWNLVPALLVLGAGMPFMFVTLTTMSLSTVDRADVTDASGLYTLARTLGGNIGYALTATLVADYTQVHRVTLVQRVSAYNPNFLALQARATQFLVAGGQDPAGAQQTANALVNAQVNAQAAMMAYNDASLWLGALFVVLVPLVFFLPGRPAREAGPGSTVAA